MNKTLVSNYISEYKTNFARINSLEYYKWQAIKCFQDNWKIEAEDFPKMITDSLALSKNLMDSGKYYPKKMLLQYAAFEPAKVRRLFRSLFDEERNLYTRVVEFQDGLKEIHSDHFPPSKNHFQDARAVLVYLTLRFPDRYYLYKFEMYKTLCYKLELSYQAKKGRIENIGEYMEVCKILRHEITKDQQLIAMHKKRLGPDCYHDESLNILTQDLIFAIEKHLPHLTAELPYVVGQYEEDETINNSCNPRSPDTFAGRKTNHLENEKERKRIGDLGEQWVLKYEESKLIRLNMQKKVKEIQHTSAKAGDGTGYDILSFDNKGNPIYIEVKTTIHNRNTPFTVTRTELERSIKETENYRLYRLFNFNEESNAADLLILKGSLEGLCIEPEQYRVILADKKAD